MARGSLTTKGCDDRTDTCPAARPYRGPPGDAPARPGLAAHLGCEPDDLRTLLDAAEALRLLRVTRERPPRLLRFSGLAISLFRDNSTRTRFSFASAANLLGLAVQDLDEGKSQIAHGETTARRR